jgi:hypothetical protein
MLKEELEKLADKIADSIDRHPEEWRIHSRGRAGIAISRKNIYIGIKTGAITIDMEGLPLFPDIRRSVNYYLALEKLHKDKTEKFKNEQEIKETIKVQNALKTF